jgi:anti-sigma-K factor RskA
MTEHEYMEELAAGYALHALTPDEEAEFVDHLQTCSRCAASLDDHELVAAQLGAMAHFQESDDAPSWESMRDAVIGSRTSQDGDELSKRRHRHHLARRLLLAAAAVVVLLGGGIAIWRSTSNGGGACSAATGCHVVQLDAAGGRSLGAVTVRDARATVTPTHMPAAPTGKVYVLWQKPRAGQATAIGEFTAGSGGPASAGTLVMPYSDTAGFAVSLETAGGAPPAVPSNVLASGATS